MSKPMGKVEAEKMALYLAQHDTLQKVGELQESLVILLAAYLGDRPPEDKTVRHLVVLFSNISSGLMRLSDEVSHIYIEYHGGDGPNLSPPPWEPGTPLTAPLPDSFARDQSGESHKYMSYFARPDYKPKVTHLYDYSEDDSAVSFCGCRTPFYTVFFEEVTEREVCARCLVAERNRRHAYRRNRYQK